MNITVATIQMSDSNDYSQNRVQAEASIGEAVKAGAKLIVLPEMALCGYGFSDAMWDGAEPLNGKTYGWVREICDRHGVYIGFCVLECDGRDYYDSFMLAGPDGFLWSHRKVEPAGYEGFFFKGAGLNECAVSTPIGRIGVIICFDTTKSYIVNHLLESKPEILIIPFAAMGMPKSFPAKPARNWEATYHSIPGRFSAAFRVPVITCNKAGPFVSPMPMGFGMKYEAGYFAESRIVDKTGNVLASVSGTPGIATASVMIETVETVDGAIDRKGGVDGKKKWFLNVSGFTRNMSECTKNLGGIRYSLSGKRKAFVRETRRKYPGRFPDGRA